MSVSFTQFSSSWHCKNLVLEESACCKTKTLCCRNLYCVCCMLIAVNSPLGELYGW